MSNFIELRNAVADKLSDFIEMEKQGLGVLVMVHAEREELFGLYLDSIPAEHNQIFRQRRRYDGNYDKHFIRNLGGVLFICNDLTVDTIWNVQLSEGNFFSDVADKLHKHVSSSRLDSYLLKSERVAGHLSNVDNYDDTIIWEHFYYKLPEKYVKHNVSELQGTYANWVAMLSRGMNGLSLDAAKEVQSLIASNNLYRGKEFQGAVDKFIELKKDYAQAADKGLWVWLNAKKLGEQTRFRSTVIGTLVEDLTNGVDLERAVASFESKVAPTNYKRTTALVTPMMIAKAKADVAELGYSESIYRELAELKDLPTDKMIYVESRAKTVDVFDTMSEEAGAVVKFVDNAVEISASELLAKLKGAKKVEVLSQPQSVANEFVLTRASDSTAPNMFKWDNTLAWAYISGTTDAIKERVKEAGGDVTGDVRVSLAWHSPCDLDLSVHRDSHFEVVNYQRHNRKRFGAELDLDMNGLDKHDSENPVENVVWRDIDDMPKSKYIVKVHNYNARSPINKGFKIQVEILGVIYTFEYINTLPDGKRVDCFILEKTDSGVDIAHVNQSLTLVSKGSAGGEFAPVSRVMMSPNCWGDTPIGNEHLMFIVDGFECKKPVRGFFNEYLKAELNEHRKVFEMLGERTMVEPADQCVGGYGYSLTSKQEFVVRIDKRIYKVKL